MRSFFISAYGLAVKHGYRGTEEEWLESLHGIPGPAGDGAELKWEDGAIWWRPKPADGTESTAQWQKLLNLTENGAVVGQDGKSAYEIAKEHGFRGTEEEWLASLKGDDGIQGRDGEPGAPGYTPVKGTDYYTEEEKDELVAEVKAALPVKETEDGYTEIEGLPEIVSGAVVKDGNTITMTMPLDSGGVMEVKIELDERGYPAKIVRDGREVPWTWTGFDAADPEEPGGDEPGGDESGRTYFYKAGDACEAVTGGWENIHSKSALTLNDDNMTVFGNEATYCMLCLRTKNTVDISGIGKLYFDILYTGPLTANQTAVGATKDASFDADTDFAAKTAMTENTARTTVEVDVSGLTGAYYIGLFGYSEQTNQNTGYTVYNVWGE